MMEERTLVSHIDNTIVKVHEFTKEGKPWFASVDAHGTDTGWQSIYRHTDGTYSLTIGFVSIYDLSLQDLERLTMAIDEALAEERVEVDA